MRTLRRIGQILRGPRKWILSSPLRTPPLDFTQSFDRRQQGSGPMRDWAAPREMHLGGRQHIPTIMLQVGLQECNLVFGVRRNPEAVGTGLSRLSERITVGVVTRCQEGHVCTMRGRWQHISEKAKARSWAHNRALWVVPHRVLGAIREQTAAFLHHGTNVATEISKGKARLGTGP